MITMLVILIRSLPETEEVRSRLDVNSESVMDKSALNDDQQEPSDALSGLSYCDMGYLLLHLLAHVP